MIHLINGAPNIVLIPKKEFNGTIIKGGFIFNTRSEDDFKADIHLSPGMQILQLGNHSEYTFKFKDPVTYEGFAWYQFPENEKPTPILLFQDDAERNISKNGAAYSYKALIYNSRKSLYCITGENREVDFRNVYMNFIQLFVPGIKEEKPVEVNEPKPVNSTQLLLFGRGY
ncbi:MAG TPA: hypothetical protein PK079_23340 [Leptospiraceae bacterium]|nr:hypothetical protein [Leptospiraceae bacterium]HMW06539.1 hypothetical protein [Leptospiraceae bacterium]HMX35293.1 hypothetical protein [Leptospiraceae bacterium]HMY32823.1 hypothetical protein [Leptospiraceae bacterium]HMZ65318.1 hypothetical protein [Leptospiraceae bacterium]